MSWGTQRCGDRASRWVCWPRTTSHTGRGQTPSPRLREGRAGPTGMTLLPQWPHVIPSAAQSTDWTTSRAGTPALVRHPAGNSAHPPKGRDKARMHTRVHTPHTHVHTRHSCTLCARARHIWRDHGAWGPGHGGTITPSPSRRGGALPWAAGLLFGIKNQAHKGSLGHTGDRSGLRVELALLRAEAPQQKLGPLSLLFSAPTMPSHSLPMQHPGTWYW